MKLEDEWSTQDDIRRQYGRIVDRTRDYGQGLNGAVATLQSMLKVEQEKNERWRVLDEDYMQQISEKRHRVQQLEHLHTSLETQLKLELSKVPKWVKIGNSYRSVIERNSGALVAEFENTEADEGMGDFDFDPESGGGVVVSNEKPNSLHSGKFGLR